MYIRAELLKIVNRQVIFSRPYVMEYPDDYTKEEILEDLNEQLEIYGYDAFEILTMMKGRIK